MIELRTQRAKLWVGILALTAILATLSQFWWHTLPPQTANIDLEAAIDWKADTTYAGFFIARENGFFAKRNLNVRIVEGNGAMVTATAVGAGGRYSIASSSADAAAVARSRGVPIKSVGIIYQRVPTVVYSRDADAIRKPTDFVGKRIGLVPGSIGVGQFDIMLKKNSIPRDKLTIENTGTDPAPVLNGQLDGMESYEEAEALQLKRSGQSITTMRLADFGVTGYGLNIIASDKMVAEHPETVRNFTSAVQEGYAFMRAHPDEAAEIYTRLFPEKDPGFVRDSIRVVATHLGNLNVGSQSKETWQTMLDNLKNANLLSQPVPISELIFDYDRLEKSGN